MQPTNFLFILSDQHRRDVTGCYGKPVVQTPHLDALAARGTTFDNAYTPCPICVPARAALATGRYVHQTGHWDNAFPYAGEPASWHHRLRDRGHRVDSIGKLHFRSAADDHGFSHEIDPLYVVDGVGDVLGSIRDDPPFRNKRRGILNAGPGDSTYLRYDQSNADRAVQWLTARASETPADDKPWALFLSLVCPHPPYIAPPDLFAHYDALDLPPVAQAQPDAWPDHPAIDYFRRFFTYDEPFSDEQLHRLTAAYYGVVTYLDGQIGRVLHTLDELGLTDSTRIVYSSDHGESLGARGLFGKFTMYEESAAVPMIAAGPDVPRGKRVATPVSLLDIFPSALDAVGAPPALADAELPGRSLWSLANEPDTQRLAFSEYHALGTRSAVYMLCLGPHKYVRYVDSSPQLFNLDNDPDERYNLADSPQHQPLVREFEERLQDLLGPEGTDARAKADQRARVEAFGGEAAVRARGAFDNSPVPGEQPNFRTQ